MLLQYLQSKPFWPPSLRIAVCQSNFLSATLCWDGSGVATGFLRFDQVKLNQGYTEIGLNDFIYVCVVFSHFCV